MKIWIPILAIALASCSSMKTSQSDALKLNIGTVTVTDLESLPAAVVNTTSGEVTYYQSPERAFEAAFASHVAMVRSLQQAQDQQSAKKKTASNEKADGKATPKKSVKAP